MLLLAILLTFASQSPPAFTVSGTVTDTSGGLVAGALVQLQVKEGAPAEMRTLADGTFSIQVASHPMRLSVSKEGFADRALRLGAEWAGLQIQLSPATLVETTTIVGRPDRLGGPLSITTIETGNLGKAPGLMVDDQLRAIPGFSLFRRSSSRVANPTTQGVTMRGLAASGASRSIVVANDLSLNDPFGGWVYWNRIPMASIDRIDVLRGGAGNLYGSDAMGGAIEITPEQDSGGRFWIDGGSHGAARGSAYGGLRRDDWMVNGAIEASTSGGFVVVAPESRGPIDVPASQRYVSAHGGAGLTAGRHTISLQGSYFSEDRGNGTPFQTNATIVRQASARVRREAGAHRWSARFGGTSQDYDQTFSAVAADRMSERPTTIQHVDTGSIDTGAEWLWLPEFGGVRTAGSYRDVRGDLFEAAAFGNAPTVRTAVNQRTGAASVQALYLGTRVIIGGGARVETWQSELRDASEGRTVTRVLPRASVVWQFAPIASLRAAAQRSYRTPTINELYRGFRVGNLLTQANAALEPETLTGGEVALIVRAATAATLRTIGFWTRLDDAIVNVTLESGPALILRQRQNAGRIRAAGVEFEVDAPLSPALSLLASVAYVDSVFTEGVGLEGLRVPQVPRWQTSVGAHGGWRQLAYSVDWRFISSQFDDDRNEFELEPSTMVNGRVGWRVRRQLEVFAAIENVLDEEQDVGRTPVRTIGLPRTSRVGVRWNW